jgi:hypothetical protein
MKLSLLHNSRNDGLAEPIVHWAAVSSGAVIGVGLTLVAGALWSAAAFSSNDSTFYNHLAWWFGGTFIVATFIAALVASSVSSARGVTAGVTNGLTSWGVLLAAASAVVLLAAVAGATTASLTVHGSALNVELVRPYVAFWSAVAALGSAAVGGVAGGLVPRRRAPAIEATRRKASPSAIDTRPLGGQAVAS